MLEFPHNLFLEHKIKDSGLYSHMILKNMQSSKYTLSFLLIDKTLGSEKCVTLIFIPEN